MLRAMTTTTRNEATQTLGRPRKGPARSRSIYPEDAVWDAVAALAADDRRSITAVFEEAARFYLAYRIPNWNRRNIPTDGNADGR